MSLIIMLELGVLYGDCIVECSAVSYPSIQTWFSFSQNNIWWKCTSVECSVLKWHIVCWNVKWQSLRFQIPIMVHMKVNLEESFMPHWPGVNGAWLDPSSQLSTSKSIVLECHLIVDRLLSVIVQWILRENHFQCFSLKIPSFWPCLTLRKNTDLSVLQHWSITALTMSKFPIACLGLQENLWTAYPISITWVPPMLASFLAGC